MIFQVSGPSLCVFISYWRPAVLRTTDSAVLSVASQATCHLSIAWLLVQLSYFVIRFNFMILLATHYTAMSVYFNWLLFFKGHLEIRSFQSLLKSPVQHVDTINTSILYCKDRGEVTTGGWLYRWGCYTKRVVVWLCPPAHDEMHLKSKVFCIWILTMLLSDSAQRNGAFCLKTSSQASKLR